MSRRHRKYIYRTKRYSDSSHDQYDERWAIFIMVVAIVMFVMVVSGIWREFK